MSATNSFARIYYNYRRITKTVILFLIISGPGVIVMLADNDAGGITTYAATGAKYGYGLIWFLVLLLPVAYYVQEMTVRLGAVTKRGHAEAIFSAFGPFWGWFSLLDLALTDWLTLVTEFIGMTAALSIFHVPPVLTIIVVAIVMLLMVLQGRYWTWEKIALLEKNHPRRDRSSDVRHQEKKDIIIQTAWEVGYRPLPKNTCD